MNEIDKEYKKRDKNWKDRIFVALFLGVVINFVILLGVEGERGIQTFYPILLVVSLFFGYILSYMVSFFKRKK